MSEEKEKKPNEPQQAEEAKQKDSDLQALVNRLKQENEELKKKADSYQKQFEEADKETHKIPPFTTKFIGTIDKLNYDLNKLNKVTTEQLSDIVESGKDAFVINDEYYILNNI